MSGSGWHGARGPIVLAALAAALLGAPAAARALDLTLQLNPGYAYTSQRSTGSVESTSDTQTFLQKYRLGLSDQLAPLLRLDLSGSLDWTQDWQHGAGAWSSDDSKVWGTDARLGIGSRPLGAQLFYQFQQRRAEQTSQGLTLRTTPRNRETFGLGLQWAPEGLPPVSALYTRTLAFDPGRQEQDTVSDVLTATTQYSPVRPVSMRYAVSANWSTDRRSDVSSHGVAQTGQLAFGDTYWDRRLALSASYAASVASVTASGAAGRFVPVQLAPQGGLGAVEPLGSTPTRIVLPPSPALVDGVLTIAAGLDLGWAASVSGDSQPRDAGVRFADPTTEVELVYVYVDRRLPVDIAAAIGWTAYRSDDNENWAEVPISGPVRFGDFDNRFELPLVAVRAPFLKVVARPLAAGVTSDRQYAAILVTELQVFRLVATTGRDVTSTSFSGTASTSARLLLVPAYNLAVETGFALSHANNGRPPSWALTSGLGAAAQLVPTLGWRARLDHSVGRAGRSGGDAAQNELRLTLGLDWAPLPVARGGVTYQAQTAFANSAVSRSYQSGTLSLSAEPYKGIFLGGDGSVTQGRQGEERSSFTGRSANASVGVRPNRWFSLGGSLGYSSLENTRDGQTGTARSGLVSATASLNPVPALSGSASVTRLLWTDRPATLWNLSAGFSPFYGGQLILSVSYNENVDVTNDTRFQSFGPSARWAIRPGVFLTGSYVQSRNSFPQYRNVTNSVFFNLVAAL